MPNQDAQNIDWYGLLVSNCRAAIALADQERYFEFVEIYLGHDERKNDFEPAELELKRNDLTLHQGRFSEIKRAHNLNTISFKYYHREISKLNDALLEFLKEFRKGTHFLEQKPDLVL